MGQLDVPVLPVTTVHGQPITMRDGTVLRASVHYPADGQGHRTVLVRTPYGEPTLRSEPVTAYLEAGLAVVLQHCRGRGDSDGEFTPWVDEGRDGADTVAWIRAQPWSNGEVVATGVSYLAGCALQLAAERPEGLRAVVATMTPYDFYDGLNYLGGAFTFGSAHQWAALQGMLGALHDARSGDAAAFGRLGTAAQLMTGVPPVDVPPADQPVGKVFPAWREWVDHPERDAYWTELAETLRHDRIDVPVLHTAGWFDIFLKGNLENHRRLGGRLIVGPWTHLGRDGTAGDLNFGPRASAQAAMLEAEHLGHLLGNEGGAPVKVFVMGRNEWRDEQEWPLKRAVPTEFHMCPGGVLSTEPAPEDAAPTVFPHDPADPVPTLGGNLMLADGRNVGARVQETGHPGVRSFVTAPLTEPLEVTGELTAVLHGSTTAPGSDWTVKLIDVHPDGRAFNVADGIVRSPSDVVRHEVDLIATSQVFLPGHRIRVDVAASNYPRFDVHPSRVASTQTLGHPSSITLPVIPA
ncbi:CocE/NonD family hydrolase [Actinocorallia sp. A-T 12471]|uniref:CocE/NonD family hydrolase n=1 Tax=Actinocorallia sp. A-T 12471 TaxID=3089813 RepID=UPI0029D03FB8|nr:CocE/NonD family hydrolase [Actinocorallia sp. A-T 12471]MDX6741262.1 CocE/NonD family hydrolase [Actinocorallia sp. A-T 12471]